MSSPAAIPTRSPSLAIATGRAAAVLVRDRAVRKAREGIAWYETRAPASRRDARALRFATILVVGLATLLPVLAEIARVEWGVTFHGAAWSLALVAVGATFVGIDRFFGFSTSWIRYRTASMQVRHALERFENESELDEEAWPGGEPTEAQLREAIRRAHAFEERVREIEARETVQWVREFEASLRAVDGAVKTDKP